MAVSESAAWSETEDSSGKTVVADAVLSIAQLAYDAGGTARGSEVKAADRAAGDKSTGASSKSHKGNNALHLSDKNETLEKSEMHYLGL